MSFAVTTEHSGNYYCTADNGHGLIQSEAVNVTVISKFSFLLTLLILGFLI